jgi:putative transposase
VRGDGSVTRAVVFTLDPSPSEERLLRSYCGAARKAYNWAVGEARVNLAVRAAERAAGVPETGLTPAMSWSPFSLSKRWNGVKNVEAPWWREVSMHAFRSGITAASEALNNWHDSRTGKRRGQRLGFPRFKSKRHATLSVSFVEINHQLSWLHPDRHHLRLMLPRSSPDAELRRRHQYLDWLHTVEPTSQLYRLVEDGQATIQKVTISLRGGRWRVSFQVRHQAAPAVRPAKRLGGLVGVDAGVRHLATLSEPVVGLTDEQGHIPNPNVLDHHLRRLAALDRQIARAQAGSKSRARLLRRRARLHGQVAQTRSLHLHRVTNALAGAFDVVAVEDLHVAGMANRKRRLGRRLADASLGELRRQLTYKTADQGHQLVAVGRFYPSSKTCSSCGAVKAKLPLHVRIFDCDHCGTRLDRDINAARTIAREAQRLLGHTREHHDQQNQEDQQDGAGLRPDSENAAPRPRKTSDDHLAATARRGEPSRSHSHGQLRSDLDGTPATASGTAA